MMGADEHHPTNNGGQRGGRRNWRGHRVVAPDGEGTEMHHIMHSGNSSFEEHRMLSAAAKRIVQLNQALDECHAKNQKMEEFYQDKMAKLHKSQIYSVDRMGKRIDVLEAELASRTVQLTRTQQELVKAVEKVVELQQEIANIMQPPPQPTPTATTTVAASLFSGIHIGGGNNNSTNGRAQEAARENTKRGRNNTQAEERSYPSSAGSESDFVVHRRHPKKKNRKKPRCKVLESNWDHDASVIVPDSFMTAVDDASSSSSTRSPRRSVVVEDHNKKDGGLSRFFQFGQRGQQQQQRDTDMVDVATKPTEYTARPNVIEDFYDVCSADGSVPDTIMVAGR